MAYSFSKSESAYDPKTVDDWWAMAVAGTPRKLAPGYYTQTQPLSLTEYVGRTFEGCAAEWYDPVGWMRDWFGSFPGHANEGKNDVVACTIGFDDTGWAADTPCISFAGCRGITIRGINLFRKSAGALVHDTNVEGNNSSGLYFDRVGFGTRVQTDSYVDPYDGLGVLGSTYETANIAGYHGVMVEGDNGTDRYHFNLCNFMGLERPYYNLSPQTTICNMQNCYWRQCTYKAYVDKAAGETSGSGNISCYDCTSYDTGCFYYGAAAGELGNLTWRGGYLDMSDTTQRQFLDASNSTSGIRVNYSGSGKRHESGVNTTDTAFIRRRTGAEEQTKIFGVQLESIPLHQYLFPGVPNELYMENPQLVDTAGLPTTSDLDFENHTMHGFYKRGDTGAIGIAYNDSGNIRTVELS